MPLQCLSDQIEYVVKHLTGVSHGSNPILTIIIPGQRLPHLSHIQGGFKVQDLLVEHDHGLKHRIINDLAMLKGEGDHELSQCWHLPQHLHHTVDEAVVLPSLVLQPKSGVLLREVCLGTSVAHIIY